VAAASRQLALLLDAIALVEHNGGPVELTARCAGLALRMLASILDQATR
jgi:hypothetical protein